MGAAILAAVCLTSGTSSAQIHSLYSDRTAMRRHDILTVLIVESAKAGTKSQTNTSKQSSYGIDGIKGSGALDLLPSFGASGGVQTGHDGRANTAREGNLVATLSARVIEVLDNGNLVIEGSKVVEINNEKEIIKVSGTVRPDDIEAENVIYSHNIADAQISYSGKGTVNEGQRAGLLTRVLNWLF
jgi:flagellar L-ring protein precursor FlgH